MLLIFFYLWYLIEYLILLIRCRNHGKAYRNISFEREAYANENTPDYLEKRRFFAHLGNIGNRRNNSSL